MTTCNLTLVCTPVVAKATEKCKGGRYREILKHHARIEAEQNFFLAYSTAAS